MSITTTRREGEPLIRLRDNPLMIAQARRRLRRKQILPTMAVTAVLALCVLLFGTITDKPSPQVWTGVAGTYLLFMAFALYYQASMVISKTALDEKLSGLLDFHRATPTTPWTDALGYLLGGGAREYLTAGVLLPFTLFALFQAGVSVPQALVVVVALLVSAWLYHAYALLVGLKAGGKRGVQGGLVLGLFILMSTASRLEEVGIHTVAYLTPIPLVRAVLMGESLGAIPFFGVDLPAPAYFLLVEGSLIVFLFLGAVRKLRSEALPAFSRGGALAFFTTCVLLMIGGSWGVFGKMSDVAMGVIFGVYLAMATSLAGVLVIATSPTYLLHFRSLTRSLRSGASGPDPMDDGAAPWTMVAGLSVLTWAGLGLTLFGARQGWSRAQLTALESLMALAWVPLFLAFVAATSHYVRLCQRASARSWALMISFMAVVLPMVLATLAHQVTDDKAVVGTLAALSPLMGIGGALTAAGSTFAGSPSTPEDILPYVGISFVATAVLTAWLAAQATSQSREMRARALGPEAHGGAPPAAAS